MLSLERALTIDGISVFRDYADPNQFWYLPGPVQLARRPGSNTPAFSFIKFRPVVGDGGIKGGGFAMLETTIGLTSQMRNKILSAVSAEAGVTQAALAAVPFESGTVQCIALNLQGSGGTRATGADVLGFHAVEEILGATSPSLDAQNRAAFSLKLSQEGAIILEQAFANGLAPIGVVYSLNYSAMRPALDVEITADFERMYQEFKVGVDAQYMFFKADIEAGFEKLKQSGAIKIKVIAFTDDQDAKDKEKWALDFFRDHLLSDWFEPTLTPGKMQNDSSGAGIAVPGLPGIPGVTPNPGTPTPPRPTPTPTPAPSPAPTPTPAPAPTPTPAPAPGPAPRPTPAPAPAPPPSPAPAAAAARLPASFTPDPTATPGSGRGVTHTPAAAGTLETLTVTGVGAQLTVNGAPTPVAANGTVAIDLPAGQQRAISVTWPAGRVDETFLLFFDFDEPADAGWSASPPSPAYRAYVDANTPADDRYLSATGVSDGAPQGNAKPWPGAERGAARLQNWLATLAAPRQVSIDAFASFEQQPQPGSPTPILADPDRADHNMRLSIRRSDVAEGIVGRAGVTLSSAARKHGDTDARTDPANPAAGDPNDRVVKITGGVAGGAPGAFRAVLARGASPATPIPTPTPTPTPTPRPTPTPTPTPRPTPTPTPTLHPTPTPPAGNQPAMNISVAFRLRFIQQEERKTVSLRYNRAEAVHRVYAPQGFIGLMLADLGDTTGLMTEVDLDDPFFRELEISAEAPGDFARIGLLRIDAAVDYGDAADVSGIKHADFAFRPGDQGPRAHSFFLSQQRALDYALTRQFGFDPSAGWDAAQSSYDLPTERTSDRTLLLQPADVFDFIEFLVLPGDIDAGAIDNIEVALSVQDGSGFARTKTFIVTAGNAPQTWRVRATRLPNGAPPRQISHTLTHHLKDGTTRNDGPLSTTAGRLVVHDPFPDAQEYVLIPQFGDTVSEAFVEIRYEDPDNHYHRAERIMVPGDTTTDVTVRIALLDPENRDVQLRFTFIGKDQSVKSGAFFTPATTIVPMRP